MLVSYHSLPEKGLSCQPGRKAELGGAIGQGSVFPLVDSLIICLLL
uniref:Uncharacterized protein n=1 Tax=Anguilla anguilla TaxID=7936 RepID=A0A0E9P7L4_ANGAN